MLSMDKLRPLLTATLLAGSISALGAAGALAATPTQTCGTITQYIPATPLTNGLLTIGGHTYTIGSGATTTGNLSLGSNSCVTTTQNSQSQVTSLTATGNSQTTATYCGTVTSFTKPSGRTPGQLGIGGQNFTLAPGTTVNGSVQPGQNACATLTFNGLGGVDSANLQQTSAPKTSGALIVGTSGTTSGSTSGAAVAGQTVHPNGSACVTLNQACPSSAVLGQSLTNAGSNGANGAPNTGGSPTKPQAAQQGGSGVGPIPDTATFAQVLGLTARTAVPVGVLGLGLLAFAGVALLRRRAGASGRSDKAGTSASVGWPTGPDGSIQ